MLLVMHDKIDTKKHTNLRIQRKVDQDDNSHARADGLGRDAIESRLVKP